MRAWLRLAESAALFTSGVQLFSMMADQDAQN
jgi:hypothetical protein